VAVALKSAWFTGALVAKSVSLPAAWLLVFLEAHSFTRCLTLYTTLPFFFVFPKLIPPSDIFEVKIWRGLCLLASCEVI
jgi:hypothetical protein